MNYPGLTSSSPPCFHLSRASLTHTPKYNRCNTISTISLTQNVGGIPLKHTRRQARFIPAKAPLRPINGFATDPILCTGQALRNAPQDDCTFSPTANCAPPGLCLVFDGVTLRKCNQVFTPGLGAQIHLVRRSSP